VRQWKQVAEKPAEAERRGGECTSVSLGPGKEPVSLCAFGDHDGSDKGGQASARGRKHPVGCPGRFVSAGFWGARCLRVRMQPACVSWWRPDQALVPFGF
jgi:hypothetical protein